MYLGGESEEGAKVTLYAEDTKPTLSSAQNHKTARGPQSHFTDEEPEASNATSLAGSHTLLLGVPCGAGPLSELPSSPGMPPSSPLCKPQMKTHF